MSVKSSSSFSLAEEKSSGFWMIWAVIAAFGCYFCMYGLRKPFSAGSYGGSELWGIGFKTVLVTTQVAGYMLSKFIGIKLIAEMPPSRRAITILYLVLIAEVALILFGVLPRPWNAICLFLNGLPLGMVFGLVLGFLEGRKLTELLAAGLCLSFIVADGVTKTVGTWLLAAGIAEDWMPSLAGVIFLAPLAGFVAMLSRIPLPTTDDIAARSARTTMDHQARLGFVRKYAWGLVPLVLMYLAVTIVRSIRSDFAPEILLGLGMKANPSTFANTELLVGMGVMLVNGGAVLIADNRRAFFISLATCGGGFCLLTLTMAGRNTGIVDAFSFYVLIGLGMYLPYVAMHTTVFERMLGMTREPGNIGFLMYVADSIGYLGYVAVMLANNYLKTSKNLPLDGEGMLHLLTLVCWLTIGLSTICLLVSWRYFAGVAPTNSTAAAPLGAAEVPL